MFSIARGQCWKCGTNYRTGRLTMERRRPGRSITLPGVREVLQTRLSKVLRDPGWKYETQTRGCGLRYGDKTKNK